MTKKGSECVFVPDCIYDCECSYLNNHCYRGVCVNNCYQLEAYCKFSNFNSATEECVFTSGYCKGADGICNIALTPVLTSSGWDYQCSYNPHPYLRV